MGTGLYWYAHAMAPGALIAAALYAAMLPARRRRLARLGLASAPGREIALALFWAWCGAMAAVLLLPADFDLLLVLRYGYKGPFFRRGEMSWQVLRTLRYDRRIFWGNVVLFLPFGFCPALLWRKSRWWKALLIAAAIPAAVESWQFFIGRAADVDDLLLNTAGAMLGWALWHCFLRPTLHCEER